MKEKILIAIDSSDSSSKVLAYGINLAGKLDAEVKVVHVIEPYSKRSTILNQLNPAMVKQTNELYELAGQELMEAAKKQPLTGWLFFKIFYSCTIDFFIISFNNTSSNWMI